MKIIPLERWEAIETDTPKAWGKLANDYGYGELVFVGSQPEEWIDIEGDCMDSRAWSDRDLYEFFDFNNIVIVLGFNSSRKAFFFFIYSEKEDLSCNCFESRKEAEERAFIEAFIILENQL